MYVCIYIFFEIDKISIIEMTGTDCIS
jgi:hypothetical protein